MSAADSFADSQPTISCPRCDHQFHRRDLLHRHLALKHKVGIKGRSVLRGNRNTPLVSPGPANPTDAVEGPLGILEPQQLLGDSHRIGVPAPAHISMAGLDYQMNSHLQSNLQGRLLQSPSFGAGHLPDQEWPQYSFGPTFLSGTHLEFESNTRDGEYNYDPWVPDVASPQPVVSDAVYAQLSMLDRVVEAGIELSLHDTKAMLDSAYQCLADYLPILHRPTFSYDLAPLELCNSIFCLSLLQSPAPGCFDAGCGLLRQMYGLVLSYVETNTVYLGDMWVFQAMLILEYCSMYYADRAAMELCDIFHGTIVTLCRRLNLFENPTNSADERQPPQASDDGSWRAWLENEGRKRIAYFVFVFDVQHALYFGHKRNIISPYSVKLQPPCEDKEWQSSIADWLIASATRDQPAQLTFDEHHRMLVQGNVPYDLTTEKSSPLAILLDIFGLVSVVLDLLQRHGEPFFDSRTAMKRLGNVLPSVHSHLIAGPAGSIRIQGQTAYHVAVIALCTPLEDLELAANDGFSRSGRTPKAHARSAIIRLLTRHKVGIEPARHAVQLIRLYMTMWDPTGAEGAIHNDAHGPTSPYARQAVLSPYETSALYLGTLALWAFVIGRVPQDAESDGDNSPRQLPMEQSPNGSSWPSSPGDIEQLLSKMDAAIQGNDIASCKQYWRHIIHHVVAKLSRKSNSNAREYGQVLRNLSNSTGD